MSKNLTWQILMIPIVYGSSILLDYLFAKGVLVLCLCVIIMAAAFSIYAKKIKMSTPDIGAFFLILSYAIVYFCVRLTVSVLQDPIQRTFGITDVQYTKFTSIFSLCYGAAQFIGGYLLGKGGIKTIGIFATIVGILFVLFSLQTSFVGLLTVRALLGLFCSIGCTGLAFYLGNYWPKYLFSTVFNVSLFVGYKGAETVSLYFQNSNWTLMPYSLGMAGIIIGIGIFLMSKILPPISESPSKDPEVLEDDLPSSNQQVETPIWKDGFIILCFIFSVFSVSIMYIAQDGWLIKLQESFAPAMESKLLHQVFFSGLAVIALLFPILTNILGFFGFMLLSSILQCIGFFIMQYPTLLGSTASLIGQIAAFSFACGGMAHSIPQILSSILYSGPQLGFKLGLLNGGAMLLGCAGSQFLFGYIGSLLFPGVQKFSSQQVLEIWRYLAPAPIIAMITAILLYIFYKNTCEEKIRQAYQE